MEEHNSELESTVFDMLHTPTTGVPRTGLMEVVLHSKSFDYTLKIKYGLWDLMNTIEFGRGNNLATVFWATNHERSKKAAEDTFATLKTEEERDAVVALIESTHLVTMHKATLQSVAMPARMLVGIVRRNDS
jgi:hypothetical protein